MAREGRSKAKVTQKHRDAASALHKRMVADLEADLGAGEAVAETIASYIEGKRPEAELDDFLSGIEFGLALFGPMKESDPDAAQNTLAQLLAEAEGRG